MPQFNFAQEELLARKKKGSKSYIAQKKAEGFVRAETDLPESRGVAGGFTRLIVTSVPKNGQLAHTDRDVLENYCWKGAAC